MNKKTTRPIFTVEFKQSAVKLVTEQGYIRQEAANNLGVSLSAITRWVRTETQTDSKPGAREGRKTKKPSNLNPLFKKHKSAKYKPRTNHNNQNNQNNQNSQK
ncbi:hypothetical protein GCM10007916_00590 [Psychromonas marina]|uniref:Transposase n=1 Tax=Psychromonas marina TaxID=88364 RepID=A0ABQ6DVA6_9GAMM|nr:transposase [Psychromonas marina]GLS88992.1 hypothetical protein GCM10007916_00590 [Psychromonas marina]